VTAMIEFELTDPEGRVKRLTLPDDSVIGKHADCDLRLSGWSVGQRHARIFRVPAGVFIDNLGAFTGIELDGERIEERQGPLGSQNLIGIGRYQLRLLEGMVPMSSACTEKNAGALDQPEQRDDQATATRAVSFADVTLKNVELHWRQRIHSSLLQALDLRRRDVSSMNDAELREEVGMQTRRIMADLEEEIPPEIDRDSLAQQVLDESVGLGPLEALLADVSVTEIMVNRHDEIYVERGGRLELHPASFSSERSVVGVIERIVTPLGRRIDEASPMVDARLKDGSRVNAVIAPLALRGASLTIRKFAKHRMTAEELVARGSMSEAMAEFLRICVVNRRNIVVSGGTGSGKTTLLNILSNFIPMGERIVTVEDSAELQLHHPHLVSLESRPANAEGKGLVGIRELVRNTLRMRPDRIVIGECRGAEALDMLQAMNTGHEGSLTTLHANTPRDALARLETMVLMAGMDLPLAAIREQIASAVNIIVQPTRHACGTRLITSIAEVTGMEGGRFQVQELFRFASQGHEPSRDGHIGKIRGSFTPCGMVPQFYESLAAAGLHMDMDIFREVA
jgi:pilus assembly protein CpaF